MKYPTSASPYVNFDPISPPLISDISAHTMDLKKRRKEEGMETLLVGEADSVVGSGQSFKGELRGLRP